MLASSWTGQHALQPLASKSLSSKRRVESYSIPTAAAGWNVQKANKGKLQPRMVRISDDRRALLIEKGKQHKVIPFCTMDRIQRGAYTPRLAQLNASVEHALSIVYWTDGSLSTLDLICATLAQYEELLTCLEDLLALVHQDKQRTTSSVVLLQWLQWQCPPKENMTRIYVLKLLETGVRIPRPQVQLPPDVHWNVHRLSQEVSQMQYTHILTSLWDDLVATDPLPNTTTEASLSPVAVLSFLRSHQREYDWQLEAVTQFLQLLPRREERWSRIAWLDYLISDANDVCATNRENGEPQESLAQYWIRASTAKTADQVTMGLLRGVRAWNVHLQGTAQKPVVGTSPFVAVLQAIRHFLQYYDQYTLPILLRLEYHVPLTSVAPLLKQILGPALYKPHRLALIDSTQETLPSPEQARGKVIVLAKRPQHAEHWTIVHDDYDEFNRDWEPTEAPPEESYSRDPPAPAQGTVIWFDAAGPIRSLDPTVVPKSPAELYRAAAQEAATAQDALRVAQDELSDLQLQADHQETLAAQLTLQAGLTPAQVKQRAGMATTVSFDTTEEQQGVEVHEILPSFVESDRDRYATAARHALEAAQRTKGLYKILQNAEAAHQKEVTKLENSHQHASALAARAKRAATEARTHGEHALQAQERIDQVRQLLQTSQDQSSSAGTVVQTALTEAKISSQRAQEAATRATRAQATAQKDRARAEQESKSEEAMEAEVSQLHEECKEAADRAHRTRERVDKASSMLERVQEELRVIENSSQYRQEVLHQTTSGPYMQKHAQKVEERNRCRMLIKEATEEHATSERHRSRLQTQFEGKANSWRVQSEAAAQARRTADRSMQLTEELEEHAAEEQEAADLRDTARQRAEAAVHTRDNQRLSVQAQLEQAERAAAEAGNLAAKSREQAETLARQAQEASDTRALQENVEARKADAMAAKKEYEDALALQTKTDRIMDAEKRRLDTTSELVASATREVNKSRVKVEPLYEQDAISAFTTALKQREEANDAAKRTEMAMNEANSKYVIAQNARKYKEEQDMSEQLPEELAALTLVHTTRFAHWKTSMALSHFHMHSLADSVVDKMLKHDCDDMERNFQAFSKRHLCRVFDAKDPVVAWALGCQLVEVNLDSEDAIVADGRFRSNNSCGYVLKPKWLTQGAKPEPQVRWSLEIIAGFHLGAKFFFKNDAINPYVTVTLSTGDPEEPIRQVHETNVIQGNGFNPVFDKKIVVMDVERPSVAMLTFVVRSKTRKLPFLGAASIPVAHMREGYRSVALFDENHARFGAQAHATLLIHATKR